MTDVGVAAGGGRRAARRGFDTLLFDLDGVVYVGAEAVPHARRQREPGSRGGVAL